MRLSRSFRCAANCGAASLVRYPWGGNRYLTFYQLFFRVRRKTGNVGGNGILLASASGIWGISHRFGAVSRLL